MEIGISIALGFASLWCLKIVVKDLKIGSKRLNLKIK